MNKNIVPDSFVSLSDFHSHDWPFDKVIRYYLNEYGIIIILGDATDRGELGDGSGGLELLLNIKKLSEKYPGRVIYIPGNHEQLLYEYAAHNDKMAYAGLVRNGGLGTIREYEELKRGKYANEVDDLIRWLGELPLQRTHEFNGQKYVFAHAFFNQRLYDENPNFSLSDLYKYKNKDDKMYKYLSDIIWFRKSRDGYYPGDLPKDGSIMVIGHTPQIYGKNNLDLENVNGDVVKVHCVDGGITYDGRMLKYDGGQNTIITDRYMHNDTSPKNSKVDKDDDILEKLAIADTLFREVIVEVMKNSSTREGAYLTLQLLYLKGNTRKIPDVNGLRERATLLSSDNIAENVVKLYGSLRDDKIYSGAELDDLYLEYVNEVAFDYVISSLCEKFQSKEQAAQQVIGLFDEGDYTYITESVGNARTVANKIGIDNMKNVIRKNNCKSVYEYVSKKVTNTNHASK